MNLSVAVAFRWLDDNVLELGRAMRLSYLPPLMVYLAYSVSGLTAIVGTFFVKEYLGLSAEFLAALGFWAGIPWAVKMPLGHLVDLLWRYKAALVWIGAALIAASLTIMVALIGSPQEMQEIMPIPAWFVLSALLAPVGYVLQDVVADAMTVEAVPRLDESGQVIDPAARKLMNTTMQTLGRVAIIAGGILVALVNIYLFRGIEALSQAEKAATYRQVYAAALIVPVISVLGVVLAGVIRRREVGRMRSWGLSRDDACKLAWGFPEPTRPNWAILGGGAGFVAFSLSMGLSDVRFGQEIIFAGSMLIVGFLMWRLFGELEPAARHTLVATAAVLFVYRAMPTPGPGVTWWMIDELGFDQQFLSVLALIASGLTLFGMFVFRRFMAERSIAYVVVCLTIVGAVLALPIIGMFYGLHEWTALLTGGIVDARFIAVVDTALESPLGQIAMIPMLAWIANSAPAALKATYFAIMASFANLALSLSQLGTKYLNQAFVVTREVKDGASGTVKVAADYSQLGDLLLATAALGVVLPLLAVGVIRWLRLRTA